MVISWTDENNKKITVVYWSDGWKLQDVEMYGMESDYLQIWYPRNLSDDIYEKYRELITWIEIEAKWKGEAYSSQMDLSLSVEDILSQFSKTRRYEVRRAKQRDSLMVQFCMTFDEEELRAFEAYYNQFALETQELYSLGVRKVEALWKSGQFVLAKIMDEHSEILAMHGYIMDRKKGIVALFSSSSHFRVNREKSALISRANSLLHYESMIYFKKSGFKVYDFGGVYLGEENPHYKSIADFKRSLGGEIVIFQNGFMIPMREAKMIDLNLCKLTHKLDNLNIILWGYSSFGKYVERQLKIKLKKQCKYIIDNGLYKEDIKCVSEKILNDLMPNQFIILICTDKKNYDKIINQDNVWEFVKANRVIHMRGEQDVAEV